ncbi:MAG: hypothetical protein M9962_06515 [Oligoflexia bacterium]|nr:hypothetical protein [Oligoflexia bacterium]
MKKLYALVIGCALAVSGSAMAKTNAELARELITAELQASIAADRAISNLINWKIGEYQEYDITAMFGNLGKMRKYVASEQGNAIWVNSETSGGMIGNNKVEALIDRATGQVLEMRQNGQPQEIPNDPIEVIDQESTTVTVPAGRFEVIHITAKSKQIKKLEVWANPRDITMDGAAQMAIDSGFLPMTLKLTSFGGR